MARLVIDDNKNDLPDGSPLQPVCEDKGVPFSCLSGNCGTCQIEIIEGKENLTLLTQEEIDMGMDSDNRLSCQCRILRGTVRITY